MSKQEQVVAWIKAHGVTQCKPGTAQWSLNFNRESARLVEKELEALPDSLGYEESIRVK